MPKAKEETKAKDPMPDVSIIDVLSDLQRRLKAPKSKYNSFGKYNYRSLEDIQEACKPLLAEWNAVIILSDQIVQVGDRYYVMATATIMAWLNGTMQQQSAHAFAREAPDKKGMDDAQITGSSSSYARKYALNGLLAIDDTKDPDTEAYGRDDRNVKQEKPKSSPVIDDKPKSAPGPQTTDDAEPRTGKQQAKLFSKMSELCVDNEERKAFAQYLINKAVNLVDATTDKGEKVKVFSYGDADYFLKNLGDEYKAFQKKQVFDREQQIQEGIPWE